MAESGRHDGLSPQGTIVSAHLSLLRMPSYVGLGAKLEMSDP